MQTTPSNIRQWSISISIALIVLLGVVTAAIFFIKATQNHVADTPRPYENNILSPPRTALSFDLMSQNGVIVSLEDFGSRPVIITFLYTQCTKACPITAGKLRQLVKFLDASDLQAEIVAISVDPEKDSVEAAYAYSKKWQMENEWHYLIGTRDELAPIWEHYWAQPIIQVVQNNGSETPDGEQTASASGPTPSEASISHAPPIFVVRNQEIILAMSNANLNPNMLVEYLATIPQ